MMGSPFQGSFQGGLSVNASNQVLSGGIPVVDSEGAASQRSLKKVTHASRPCKRCIARGFPPEQCVDAESKKRGRKKTESADDKSFINKKRSSSGAELSPNTEKISSPNHPGSNRERSTSIPPTQLTQPVTDTRFCDNLINLFGTNDQEEKAGDFLWLMDQMVPGYFNDTSSSPLDSVDPLAFTPQSSSVAFNQSSNVPAISGNIQEASGMKGNPADNYDPTYEQEQPPSLFIRSKKTINNMTQIMIAKGVISESEIVEYMNKLESRRDKLHEIRRFISSEQKVLMKKEFDVFLTAFKNGATQIGVPALIWERSGVVHYVNQSFIDMTGFSMKLPSSVDDFALLQILSSSTLYNYTKFIKEKYFNTNIIKKIMGAGIKLWKGEEALDRRTEGKAVGSAEKTVMGVNGIPLASSFCEGPYIEGTLCITIKRDILGLPMLLYGHFLPSSSAIAQLHL
ncbi:hypothetical protein PROFUN_00607 [Planoprotostelium fungivorum]|uniref:ERT1/acuK family PAS domain-containing protein n=1 Tax=Planoprotostelium fungivorum TaxID=1890364 RepID=A0A2P6NTY2_9EUKA|nr:hypothetical protein PROFUN_00607 [Planoprotostelium fungivorum]